MKITTQPLSIYWKGFNFELGRRSVIKIQQTKKEEFILESDISGAISLMQSINRQLDIHIGRAWLQGNLTVPHQAKGLVLFAHGSGSSRHSPRNQFVASELNQAGLATCLFDLLSLEEEQEDQISNRYRFDIDLLAQRLVEVTDWMEHHIHPKVPMGYFGASTGAAAALIAAAERPDRIKAVVSRGGRPDMAVQALHKIQSAVLLLVGSLDDVVIELNRLAYRQLPNDIDKELVIVSGAGHLFEEPNKLNQVAQYAAQWFDRYLGGHQSE
jgi:putative phosphoribosyl transferase